MKSNFYSISKEELKEIICSSSTIKEVVEKINVGLQDAPGNRKTLFRIIKEYDLDKELEELRERTKIFLKEKNRENIKKNIKNNTTPDEQVFCKNSKYPRKNLRDRIIKNNLIEYKCSCCGISEYNEKPISLQLHHINGIRDDNRLENLTLLCPNCHSQTDNYSGRNRFVFERQNKEKQKELAKKIKEKEKEELIKKRREELDNIDLFKFGWITKVAEKWKVSRTQVKRWIKQYYPDLKYLNFDFDNENRIEFLETLNPAEKGWAKKAAQEWGVSVKEAQWWILKHYPKHKTVKKVIKEDRIEFLKTLDMSKKGWIKEVAQKWGVKERQVRKWIKKYYSKSVDKK